MSCQITLSTWFGKSKTEAAEKLSRIFRLNNKKGLATVECLCEGLPWRFENTISDQQATQAAKIFTRDWILCRHHTGRRRGRTFTGSRR
jgi:hypothetical protein